MSMSRVLGMKAPRLPGPSPEELEMQRIQKEELERQRQMAEEQSAQLRMEKQRTEMLRAANRVGIRSLLSGDWQGFRRGGDLGAR